MGICKFISNSIGGICLAILIASQPAPVSAQASAMVVSYDMGGLVGSRQKQVQQLRQQGRRVEIRGRCYSACTMYLGLPNVCVHPRAVLGFHGPRGTKRPLQQDVFDHWSRVMSKDLQPQLRSWFMQTARHVKSGTMNLSGSRLIKMGYQRC